MARVKLVTKNTAIVVLLLYIELQAHVFALHVVACRLLLCVGRKAMSVNGSQTAKFLLHKHALRHNHPLPHYDTVCYIFLYLFVCTGFYV